MDKRRHILTRDEVEVMIAGACSIRDQALVAVLYILGCRISEALALRVNDIIIRETVVSFRIVSLKRRETTEYVHTVTVSKETPFINIVTEYIDAISITEDNARLFPFDRIQAWRIVKKLNPNAWLHLFRHTRLTKLAEQGANPFQLQIWAGWKSIKQADTYVRKSDKMILDLANRVE